MKGRVWRVLRVWERARLSGPYIDPLGRGGAGWEGGGGASVSLDAARAARGFGGGAQVAIKYSGVEEGEVPFPPLSLTLRTFGSLPLLSPFPLPPLPPPSPLPPASSPPAPTAGFLCGLRRACGPGVPSVLPSPARTRVLNASARFPPLPPPSASSAVGPSPSPRAC